ncbi:Hypothetical predicted protein [Mytilus galloprovincialis]|uniref:Uncharacterized protein n=1 Tax=Mytilus galloprovincialis TaxID=29158 RepID=A0A8B6FWV7_MYTGA|nr:Hypothetical predicted protein [Mytilus galloprovincialis]
MKMYRERKKQQKSERNKLYYEMKQNERIKEYKNSIAAVKKRRQREKHNSLKQKAEARRLKNLHNVRRFREKRKGEENLEIVEIEDVTNFTNRMQKSRAMKKLKRALPQTPRKKAELLINLLTGKKSKQSPTMAKLRQMNIVKSPDEIENDEIAKHVLVDVKKVLTHTKAQRSKDSLVTKHIILAAVSGESVTENRCKKKLASKLEVPIRRLSGGCSAREEIQSSYFQRTEVSLHVSIIYRHAVLEYDGKDSTTENPNIIKEHFFVVSNDDKHDHHFVHEVQNQIKEYLNSISYNVSTMHEYTDGCQCQYKSRHCMGDVSNGQQDFGYDRLIRNYFETSHAKEREGLLSVRNLSCYSCDSCLLNMAHSCQHTELVGLVKNIQTEKERGCAIVEDISPDDDFEVVDMIRKGSLVALYTDDEGADFYLMKDGSCQEKLKSSETDDWQGQYPEGTTVIRGLYYRKTGPLSYSLIKRKNVIVSVKSVLYVTNDILTDSVIDLFKINVKM